MAQSLFDSQSLLITKNTPLIICCDNTEQQVKLCAQLAQDFEDITACSLKQLPERVQNQPSACLIMAWQKPCAELVCVIEFADKKSIPLLLLTQQLNHDDAHYLVGGNSYVLLPLSTEGSLVGWVQYAKNVRLNEIKQTQTIQKLHQKLEDRKYVDQAKGLLMKLHHLDEQQAYQALRTSAMKNSQTLGQVAKNLIATLENISL
ncbi:ANTAR domain-containing response regulator [Vibrio algivorus]|uniref:ANTAR domain-containing protein n=1 Tax=Vibrio algivorus TaxID=1667024 RepID=A0ABQ6EL88_9VIBR|nr:ANTAR domain-containing protein [Vibrio algivorus]GLT13640.1 ANTAR domain-containing protein [Vibrio algivorus]